jgi:hypothetical protein
MAMTPQQAQMAAMQLRAKRPELRNMAVKDLAAQIMASEGAPGAGNVGLADLFPTKLTAASPAPMRAARLEAPKPTAMIVPGSNAARPDPRIPVGATGKTLVVDPQSVPLADWQKEMIAGMQAGKGTAQPDMRESAVAAAAPAAAPAEAAPEKPKTVSRYRTMFEQKQAELEQLKASVPASGETPPKLAIDLDVLTREVNQLKGLVAAEEGAVVDADRAAILERQTKRLGREEELVERARKRAPFDALIAGGTALAGARPGESFASALARGLAAGSESYTGARDAREASLRGIEEKRDTFALQSIDAVQKARDEAIAIQNAGGAMTELQTRLAGMSREAASNLALEPLKMRVAKAEASEAEIKAETARETIDAENAVKRAQAIYYQAGGGRGGDGGDKPMTANQLQSKIGDLSKERRGLMIDLNNPATVGPEKAAIKLAIQYIDRELAELRGGRAPAAPARAAPVAGAKQAANGKWYVPDPKRSGKYLEVTR